MSVCRALSRFAGPFTDGRKGTKYVKMDSKYQNTT